jgi:Tfp pilus assembly protein PilF
MLAAARPSRWPAPLALALLTGLAYANAAPKALVFDDETMLGPNARVGGVRSIPQLFRVSARDAAGGNRRLYRPLAMATLSLDRSLYRGDPRGYHVTSILLHVAATLVLFRLLSALGASGKGAFLAALVFGVHPIHTEAVDVAFNRSELLACLFVLGALAWLWRGQERRPYAALAGATALYLLALLSRESAVTLPLLAALLLVLLRPTASPREQLSRVAPLLVLAIPLGLYLALRGMALGGPGGGALQSLWAEGIGSAQGRTQRLALLAVTLRDHWRMLVWPWPLRASYEDYVGTGLRWAPAFHAALLGLAMASRRRAPALTVGILFFYVALLPSSRLFADPAILAERFLYLPSAGMMIPLAFGLSRLDQAHKRAATALGLALVAVLLPLTWKRNQAWHSREALWEAEFRVSDRDWRVLLNLSQVRLRQGRLEEALALSDRGLQLAPGKTGFHTNRGIALASVGRLAEAEAAFARAAEQGQDAGAWANLARLHAATGRTPRAEQAYREAMAREADPALRYVLEAEMWLHCRADRARARAAYEAALALSPDLPPALQGLRRLESR